MDSLPVCDIQGEYADPIGRLLLVGERRVRDPENWPDYAAEFGITQDHVGALIRMMGDPALNYADPDSREVWAPVHAWRALGQLRAEASIGALLAMLGEDHDDPARGELPHVLAMIGPAAIPALLEFMADHATDVWSVAAALEAIKLIAQQHPACRDECVAILARTLEPARNTKPGIAGFAIWFLTDLGAVETISAIRDAFARGAVDISIGGDLEDTEIALGLRTERATPKPRYVTWPFARLPKAAVSDLPPRPLPAAPRRAAAGRNDPCPCGSGKKYKKCCL